MGRAGRRAEGTHRSSDKETMEKKFDAVKKRRHRKRFIFGDIIDPAVVLKLTATVVFSFVFGILFMHSRIVWQRYQIDQFYRTNFKNFYTSGDAYLFGLYPQKDYISEFNQQELIVNTSMYFW